MDLINIIFTAILVDSIPWTEAGLLRTVGSLLNQPLNVLGPSYPTYNSKEDLVTNSDEDLDQSYDRDQTWYDNLRSNERIYGKKDLTHSNPSGTHRDERTPNSFTKNEPKKEKYFENNKTKTINKAGPGSNIGLDKEDPVDSSKAKTKDEVKVLEQLTKKKFYYQVQPVVPENERKNMSETIFYDD